MKRNLLCIVASVFIVIGIILTVYYGNAYGDDTEDVVYCCFSILFGMASTMTAAALVLYTKAKKGALVISVYILAGILCVPVILFAMFWLLHWIGIDFLPPPQR
jgi:drug/metabolite transporter (DMT)-like permease